MATTSSSTLTASTAITGRGGNGKGKQGRAAGLVATAALGLALLGGLVFAQVHRAAPATLPAAPAGQLGPAALERERNLLIEQNALPELTDSIKLEQNLRDDDPGQIVTVERLHFLEWNTIFLPGDSPATFEPPDPRVMPR